MRGGTILRAHGTIENSLLHLFALDDQRKEIVMMAGPSTLCREVMQKLAQVFHLKNRIMGIAFSLPLFKV